MIKIELLSTENFNLYSLDHYPRKQDDWDLEKRRSVAKDISSDEYITYLAIEKDEVVGFIGLKKDLVESYMILDMMQVSASLLTR